MAYFDDEEDDNLDMEVSQVATDQLGQKLVDDEARAGGAELEQEFDSSPSASFESISVQPERKPAAAAKQIQNSPEKYSGIMDEYKALQEKRGSDQKRIAIIDAMTQIGQAVAGKHALSSGLDIKSNYANWSKMADQPVQDYSDRIKQKGLDVQLKDIQDERSPNSIASQKARMMAQQRGYPVDANMSAKDVKEIMGMGDPLKERAQRQQIALGDQKLKSGRTSLFDADELRNVDSEISGFYRSMAMKRGFTPEDVEGKSAYDIANMGKILGHPTSGTRNFQTKQITDPATGQIKTVVFDTSTGQMVNEMGTAGFAQRAVENKRTGEMENYNPAIGRTTAPLSGPSQQTPVDAQAPTPKITREQLSVNKQKQLDDYRKMFLEDTKEDRTALQASKGIQNILASGKALDGDILRLVQNKFARASGERGAMTEQDVAPYGGRQAVVDRINRQMKMWTSGKINDDDRKFLSGLATMMQKQTESDLGQRTKFFSNNLYQDLKSDPQLQNAEFNPASVESLLGSDVYTDPGRGKVKVRSKKTGKEFMLDSTKVEKARQDGLIE